MADKKKTIKDLEKELEARDAQIENLITRINMHKQNEEVLKEIIIRQNIEKYGIS